MTRKAHLSHSEQVDGCVWCLMEHDEEARQAVWDASRRIKQAFEETAEQAQRLTVILAKLGEQINEGQRLEERGTE